MTIILLQKLLAILKTSLSTLTSLLQEQFTLKILQAGLTTNNRTDIELWLKTSVSSSSTLTRNIFSWSKPIIKWQENSSSSITAYYNLTGLYPNSLYKIYNGSQLTYTLQTDSSGNLNFNLTINSTSRNITVQYQNCEESIYSLPYTINKKQHLLLLRIKFLHSRPNCNNLC